MKTAVIIPNYNGYRFLPACMEALDRQSRQDFLTIVVDNASSDESLHWLSHWSAEAPDRRLLLRNPKNLGFSAAVNLGIRRAAAQNLSYVLLLNNDTSVLPDFLERLESEMEQDRTEQLFAISSRMVKMHDSSVMDDAGDQYTLLGWQFQRGLEEPVQDWNRPAFVFSACAGAALYRLSALKKTGLFDIAHFAYLEDLDISYRARLLGYRILYLPTAVCRHVGSGTSGSKYNSFKVRLSARNSWYLPYKNMPNAQLLLNAPFLAFGYLVKLLYFQRMGFGRDYRAGLREGFRNAGRLQRVHFSDIPLHRFLRIEWELLLATVEYLLRMRKRAMRRTAKKKESSA